MCCRVWVSEGMILRDSRVDARRSSSITQTRECTDCGSHSWTTRRRGVGRRSRFHRCVCRTLVSVPPPIGYLNGMHVRRRKYSSRGEIRIPSYCAGYCRWTVTAANANCFDVDVRYKLKRIGLSWYQTPSASNLLCGGPNWDQIGYGVVRSNAGGRHSKHQNIPN